MTKRIKNQPVIDAHCHIGPPLSGEELIQMMDQAGVDKVVFGSDHFSRGQKNLYGNFFYILKRAFPDTKERKLVLGGNMAKIFGCD